MEKDNSSLEKRYKLAIDARDKLNENYHKWMTFYYVANGSILVAITTLYSKPGLDKGVFVLSIIGAFVCMLWNLSCKGYTYWSRSWINIIIDLEKKVFGEDNLVYGAFSKNIAENEGHSWCPLEPNNISTPKLTLIFSFLSFLSWAFYSVYAFRTQFEELPDFWEITCSVLIFLVIIVCYILLPRIVKSRQENMHKLT